MSKVPPKLTNAYFFLRKGSFEFLSKTPRFFILESIEEWCRMAFTSLESLSGHEDYPKWQLLDPFFPLS